MKQKTVCIDYRSQLKDCMDIAGLYSILRFARKQWMAVGGTVDLIWLPHERKAHLKVSGVAPEIVALVHETTDQGPDISYIRGDENGHD